MKGFHICNISQFRPDYLKKWLKFLAEAGYDTVLWELENSIQWESCPECAAPDALAKDEFKKIIALCRELGLEPIPLFQTLGHCEYVLKIPKYGKLAETPGCIYQYCPSRPEVLEFLGRWIEEYIELFGELKHFHLGMDEAAHMGECPECASVVAKESKSALYMRHVNALNAMLVKKGIRPMIWCDMVLTHPEALDSLDRRVIIFDWMYDIRRNDGKVWVWRKGKFDRDTIPAAERKLFESALFPLGDEPGRAPETFYTADFLAQKGFDVLTCPASSSYGDNVFSPRHYCHLSNTFDSFAKGSEKHLSGSVLTSWTVHLFPWELQAACIKAPQYLAEADAPTLEGCQRWLSQELFGIDTEAFWKASGLLSKSCLFSHTATLGFNQSGMPVPPDFFRNKLKEIGEKGTLEEECANSRTRLAEYKEGLKQLEALEVSKGHEMIALWRLAARNLVNRAKASICLLENELKTPTSTDKPQDILREMEELRIETGTMYREIVRPYRWKETMRLIYDGVAAELKNIS